MDSTLTWPLERLGEALAALVRRTRLGSHSRLEINLPAPNPSVVGQDSRKLGEWLMLAAEHLGVEAELAQTSYGEISVWLRGAAPALLRLPDGRFVVLLGRARQGVMVLRPDLIPARVTLNTLRNALCAEMEAPFIDDIGRLLDRVGMSPERRARAAEAMLHERLGARPIANLWQLRLSPAASFIRQMAYQGLFRQLGVIFVLHLGVYLAYTGSWWVAGQGSLAGINTLDWWLVWALLLALMMPLRLVRYYLTGLFNIGVGGLMKQRLLFGALRLEPDEIRHQGIGQLIGRVHEAEALEATVLFGGLYGLLAVVELVMGFFILASGAGGLFHASMMVIWVVIITGASMMYFRRRRQWTETRRAMTHDLVERMVGYRTRLAQEIPEHWHTEEDLILEGYLENSRATDTIQMVLTVLLQRGWLVIGLIGLVPTFIAGGASIGQIAVGLGGVVYITQVLDWKFIPSFLQLIDAAVIWGQVAPLFHAAARPELKGAPTLMFRTAAPAAHQPMIVAHHLSFRYHERADLALRGCDLQIEANERLLLEGPSGGGKTTLAALLVGLRQPEAGLLLLNGLDRDTLGTEHWRQRVVAAPQFHENHVLSETFAFNLLMGRHWPPTQEDLTEAEVICTELGLDTLLAHMPLGMQQWVGDTGWQLSHGERSRLYIARALLQNADLVVLDESFAALDPDSLRQTMECVLRRAKTLLVIAHP